ncbi:MAG: lipoprotein [Anaeromyxobacteraceae bacterium]
MSRAAALAALLFLAGCGVKAPPRPPIEPKADQVSQGGPPAPAAQETKP